MLAWFVHIYSSHNSLTPDYILVLFIVSVLAAAWAIFTLFSYHRSKSNALFVSFIDLCFVGALIASAYELRFVSHQSCVNIDSTGPYAITFGDFSATVTGITVSASKTCTMLKASFAFAIMNCIFFLFTSFLAMLVGRRRVDRDEKVVVTETHRSRHSQRRSGSHRSHRSGHSRRSHAYV
jgi:hypothetical protein